MEKFPTINPDIGSPEHFEQAKNQNKSNTPADWSELEKWGQEQGPAPWNDTRWQSEPKNHESANSDPALDALYSYATTPTSEHFSQKTEIGQPSTKLLTALATAIPSGALVGDMALNGTSEFVAQNPAIAIAGIVAFAGAVAVTTNKILNNTETDKGGTKW